MKRTSLIATAILAGMAAWPTHGADFSAWARKMSIQFAGYGGTGETLTNFPVLVQFAEGSNQFHYADLASPANAADLRFADATGTNELNYEIESWNTNGTSFVWVQVPQVVDTTSSIQAFYGRKGQSVPAYATNGATWSQNYLGVWHMAQTNAQDSTANHYNGAAQGSVTQLLGGVIGPANILGPNNYVQVADQPVFMLTTNYSLSAWIKPGTTNTQALVGTYNNAGFIFAINTSRLQFWDTTAWRDSGVLSNTLTNDWKHIVYTRTGTTNCFYVNGLRVANLSTGTGTGDGGPLTMGRANTWGNNNYSGPMDEVRLSAAARSSNWVQSCWMNAVSNRTFNQYADALAWGSDIDNASGAAAITSTNAWLNGTLSATGTPPTSVWVYWDTADQTTNKTWAFSSNLVQDASLGALTCLADNLTSNTVYYYTYYASNSVVETWAKPSKSFKTLDVPGVDNAAGATLIRSSKATLNGTLTNGASAHVYFLWGATEGTATNVLDAGTTLEGQFSKDLFGLAYNSTYYYTAFASNDYGTATASPVTNFTTLGIYTVSATTYLVPAQSNLLVGDTVVVTGSGVSLILSNSPNLGELATYAFTSLTVTNGATVICLAHTNGPSFTATNRGVAIQCAGDVVIAAGSAITSTTNGFRRATGPGMSTVSAGDGGDFAGASHGGVGGRLWWWRTDALAAMKAPPAFPPTYGSLTNPLCLGSGGRASGMYGGCGGGAIKIVANSVLVNGSLAVNGGNSFDVNNGSGGDANTASAGSGGSIWIVASTVTGTGQITAHGGDQNQHYNTGGGAGGRIAIFATNNFGGRLAAWGGRPAVNYDTMAERGGAGTIFLKTPQQTYGELLICNTNTLQISAMTHLAGPTDTATYLFDKVTLSTNAILEIVSGQTLDMSDPARPIMGIQPNSAFPTNVLLNNGGTIALPETYSLTNYTLATVNGSSLGGLKNLTVGPPGGVLAQWQRNLTLDVYRLELTLANLDVQAGGVVKADLSGRAATIEPGCGKPFSGNYAGGNHAGLGGNTTNPVTFGNPYTPTNSGGAGSYWYQRGEGGGIIKLTVTNNLIVNGTISSKGADTTTSGAGAGGSIWLVVNNLAGTSGAIRANGGASTQVGPGGGGRVAIEYRTSTFTNMLAPGLYTNNQAVCTNITAKYGGGTATNAGSVYIRCLLQPLVDNANGATNVTSFSAWLMGTVVSTGEASTTVTCFWGPSDATTNLTGWANTDAVVTVLGAVSNYVSTLSSATTYYYRYYATNDFGEYWSYPSKSFLTFSPPTVSNDGGAIPFSHDAAQLRGLLTGGAAASASFFWWDSAGIVTNRVDVGPCLQGVVFSTNITGLARNTTYYYSAYASNFYGTATALPPDSFTTPDALVIYASTNLVPAQSNFFVSETTVMVNGSNTILTLAASPNYGENQQYFFNTLKVTNGASVVCLGQTNGLNDANAKGVTIVATTVVVYASASINADGMGFVPLTGPGKATSGNTAASHGGVGGQQSYGNLSMATPDTNISSRAVTYGSLTSPTSLGSGGWYAYLHGGYGGGAIKVMADTVTVNGRISAYGGDNQLENFANAGAGGSVWIVATTLSGSGEITAHGGNQNSGWYQTGGGGGGRVAVNAVNNLFTGTAAAWGGKPAGNYLSIAEQGGAGTVYLKTPAQTYGELLIVNSNTASPCAMAHLAGMTDTATYAFDKITLSTNAILEVVPGQTVDMSDPARLIVSIGSPTGVVLNSGTFSLPATYSLTNYVLAPLNGASLGALKDLTIGPPGGVLAEWARAFTAEVYRLDVTLDNLTILPGGLVTADGCGFGASFGPGQGWTNAIPKYFTLSSGGIYLGGNYGGVGQNNTNITTYGNPYAPTNAGSSGYFQTQRSEGGGIIKLTARNTLTVNGLITAKAFDTTTCGAGSGGSIYLIAENLAGTGTVRAVGGTSTSPCGGGGGRVAIKYHNSTYTGLPAVGLYTNADVNVSSTILARGGYNQGTSGLEDGSIYVERILVTGSVIIIQ